MKETDKVNSICLKGLDENPAGLHFAELCRYVQDIDPSIKYGTITHSLNNLCQNLSSEVFKPERGLFQLLKYKNDNFLTPPPQQNKSIHEEDFYQSFADWLTTVVDDCTIAKPLGGNRFGLKWGTPDVVGTLKQDPIAPYKANVEIVSAEIKATADQLVTAFGQACSYKLFSHKVYLVAPADANRKVEIDRIDSLCYLFGIGFVLFDVNNTEISTYILKHRAQKHTPDTYYINQNIEAYPIFWKDLL
jgi:hypothetical protein